MNKFLKNTLLAIVAIATLSSCYKDNDDVFADKKIINNFIYRGMNAFYLYKGDVAVLANDRFANQLELESYHTQFDSPEMFFESLVFDRARTDRFSILFNDYVALENILAGNTLSNGMEFGLVGETGSSTAVYGYVRYVQPNSSAARANVQRGMIFNSVNGTPLTRTNIETVFSQNSYSIGLANLNAGVTTATGTTITLNKEVLQEDPILVTEIINQGSQKIGYLMYNGFLSQFDEQLNNVFGDFRTEGITHLVLDLRYNGGGSVNTAVILGSLITGNNTTDVFSREQWNADIQANFLANNPGELVNNFTNQTSAGNALNRLNLNKVHIITTGNSASASELVINSLKPYIDVVQVGANTAGKFQASITLYDSPSFRRSNANPGHRYAMQPLVLKSSNAAGVSDYFDGLAPNLIQSEDFENLGILGNVNEPLLARCLEDILQNGSRNPTTTSTISYDEIMGSKDLQPFGSAMWKELPE
jgi:C-terminal processing protease CtpA/Prc